MGCLSLKSMKTKVANWASFNSTALLFLYVEDRQYAGIPIKLTKPEAKKLEWQKEVSICLKSSFFKKRCTTVFLWNAQVMSEDMQIQKPSDNNSVSVLAALPVFLHSPAEPGWGYKSSSSTVYPAVDQLVPYEEFIFPVCFCKNLRNDLKQ